MTKEQQAAERLSINTLIDDIMYGLKDTKFVSMEDIFRPLLKVSPEQLLEQSGTPYQVMLQQTFGHLRTAVPLLEEARNNKSTFDVIVQCVIKCPAYVRQKAKDVKVEVKEKETLVAVA